ncbi:ankyrin repeat domain-containing protein [Aquimarina spongiae]|nr:ankyrin repeat domain-containing protein [Aquimarina spongiae]
MKKTFLFAFAAMLISSAAFATDTTTSIDNQSYEVTTVKTSPFCMAIVKGDVDTVKKMIELGSDVNQKSLGMTPLMYAARYNRVEIMKLLIDEGANVKTRDKKGYTAMKFAELSNAQEAVALLKEVS